MAEAIKGLAKSGKVKKNDFAGETITGAVDRAVARQKWNERGACEDTRVLQKHWDEAKRLKPSIGVSRPISGYISAELKLILEVILLDPLLSALLQGRIGLPRNSCSWRFVLTRSLWPQTSFRRRRRPPEKVKGVILQEEPPHPKIRGMVDWNEPSIRPRRLGKFKGGLSVVALRF